MHVIFELVYYTGTHLSVSTEDDSDTAIAVQPTHRPSDAGPSSILCQSVTNLWPIVNAGPIHHQSDVNLFQSSVNQVPIHPDTMSIMRQLIPIGCRSIASTTPIICQIYPQSFVNSIRCQFGANPVLTWSRSIANPMYQSSPNPSKSSVNQVPIWFQSISIRCQSNANSAPTRCQSSVNSCSHGGQSFANNMSINKVPIHPNQMQIWCQSDANQTSIKHQSIALWCQSIPIWCQSSTNPVSNKLQSIPATKINPVPI